jgi:aquaporin Z
MTIDAGDQGSPWAERGDGEPVPPTREPAAGGSGTADAQPDLARRLLAEAVGTFALVFVAVGGDATARLFPGEIPTFARAVAPALMVTALIYSIGDVSGAHLNPAVTAAFAMRRLFPVRHLPGYWLAQLIGALLAAATVQALFGDAVAAGVSTPHVPQAVALGLEIAFAGLLVTVILGTADRARIVGPDAALAVGATIALCGLIGLPVEGASMNPARSLAPALVTGDVGAAWIYVVGPLAGATIAVAVATVLHGTRERDSSSVEAAQGRGGGGT